MTTESTLHIGRIPIRHLSPVQPEGLWPAKAFVGEVVPFSATVFREGHDIIGVDLELTSPSGSTTVVPFPHPSPGVDEWRTTALVAEQGTWSWRVKAYSDDWARGLWQAGLSSPSRAPTWH